MVAFAIRHDAEAQRTFTASIVSQDPLLDISIKEAAIIKSRSTFGEYVADPLIERSYIDVAPGEIRQMYFLIKAEDTGVDYSSSVVVKFELNDWGEVSRSFDIEVRHIPASQQPYTVAWGYLNDPLLTNVKSEAADKMLDHGINTAVFTPTGLPNGPTQIPWPFGAQPGDPVIGYYPDFDEIMGYFAGSTIRLFYLGFKNLTRRKLFNQYEYLSDDWKLLFRAWIKEWSDRLIDSGYSYDDFAFYIVDEPGDAQQVGYIVDTSYEIKQVDARLNIYTTLSRPELLTDELINAVDIFQLYRRRISIELTPGDIDRIKNAGKRIWSYGISVLSSHLTSTTFDHRSLAWEAFLSDFAGFGFWSYSAIDGSAWDGTDGVGFDYSVVYDWPVDSRQGLVSSKRADAFREGVQDWWLLHAALAAATTQAERDHVYDLAQQGMVLVEDNNPDARLLEDIRRQLFLLVSDGGDI